ncbi:hypothetical protein C8Q74DRAFT_403438 [Fomes fomentarius]|nr:hypothetical protein C8Q74DRAFT_403438 [Fomes fomentarius]
MNDSRLPVEICEHIIDSDNPSYYSARKYWCCTALVCSAWLPRSRFNLYSEVELQRSGQARLLLRTLEENSHLAQLVVELDLYNGMEYIPVAQLARLLKNCVILDLFYVYSNNTAPYVVDACLYSLSLLGIVKLSLSVQRSTARALLRFIRSLAKLEDLTIFGSSSIRDMRSILALGPRRSQNGTSTALSKLKTLNLEVRNFSEMLESDPDGFHRKTPYTSDIHQITLEMLWCTYTQRFMMTVRSHCIQNFHRLQTLDIIFFLYKQDDTSDPPAMIKIRRLFTILTNENHRNRVSRSGLLDLLFGAHMLAVLDRFPSLIQLHFGLIDNDEIYDGDWWEEEMVRRLPSRLHAAVSVNIWDDGGRDVWLPEEDETTDENAEDETTDEEAKVETAEEEAQGIVTNGFAVSSSTAHSQLDPVAIHGGVRTKILDAGGYVAYRVDYDLESEDLGKTEFDIPQVEVPLSTHPAV